MKRSVTAFLAALSLGLGGGAVAQTTMTTSHVTPNGAVRTTSRTVTPYGVARTRTVDRPDGTRTVIRTRTRTDERGYGFHHRYRHHVAYGHAYAYGHERVCRTEWRHHERIRICTSRHHRHHYD